MYDYLQHVMASSCQNVQQIHGAFKASSIDGSSNIRDNSFVFAMFTLFIRPESSLQNRYKQIARGTLHAGSGFTSQRTNIETVGGHYCFEP